MTQPVPEVINFPQEEKKILAFWKEIDAFHECLKQSTGKPRYSFYDGPPFATGLPHYGHILAGSIKDVVTRYAHQNGYHVERRFGWDCHGLPVEFEIDKKLGIKGPDDVEKLGIANYNGECRKIVMRYSSDWENIVTRLGRWIDFKNDYKTLYPSFMESIWWVFSELWKKGLVYKGVKVMPYSTACNTPLSNFESGQNYKEVTDPAVVVTFPLKNRLNVSLLAWTTTPWTLPSNLALCVNPDLEYVEVQERSSGKIFILMECRLNYIFKNDDAYDVLKKFEGKVLKGEHYIPLFSYYSHMENAFVVLTDSYVTTESGSGVVHQAPYFGEDDNRVCLHAGVITKDQEPVCPIDASGKFTKPVEDFYGQYVKDADKNIIKYLKGNERLFSVGTVKHSYPFCWRSETPLIYRAVPSWFIRVESMNEALLKANESTYWVPDFVKEKRFGNWLREARDWAVSRNRYWGTPIPLWVSHDMEEVVCISSIADLEKLTGEKIRDLHRESIDHLTIPSKRPGFLPLKRIPEVFDCWFESGSMPYAQLHYPFENTKDFDTRFPADFIAEGIDQTRGWFYTLLVISTALFNKAPFKNLIANGLVLASDGQKMSKRKKNYPDPMEVINKHGADALRLYLINSPVVRAESLRFKEEGVRDILKDVFLPWYNAYRFFMQNVERIKKENDILLEFDEELTTSTNLMDQWILSFTQSLQNFVHREMKAYRLYTVVPRLVQFIENLTNWYVRMNRRRIRGEAGFEQSTEALCTLGTVLSVMVRLLAPYTPFLTELMFKNLCVLTKKKEQSVHFVLMPEPRHSLVNEVIERAVEKMQCVIDLGRIIRDRKTIPVKYPLKEVVIILQHSENIRELQPFHNYIMEELNVKNVTFTTDKKAYGVVMHAEPDHKELGLRLRGEFKKVAQAIKDLKENDLQTVFSEGYINLFEHKIMASDLRIMLAFSGPTSAELSQKYEAHSSNDVLVLMDVTPDESMLAEGLAREIINRAQKLRKKAKLIPTDKIIIHYEVTPADSELARVAVQYTGYIESALKSPFKSGLNSFNDTIIKETLKLKGTDLTLLIESEEETKTESIPYCRYLNVCLCGVKPRYGITGNKGSILLENPRGENLLDLNSLKHEVKKLFGLQGTEITLMSHNGKVLTDADISKMCATTVYVTHKDKSKTFDSPAYPNIVTRFTNVNCCEKKGVLIMENPVGECFDEDTIVSRIEQLFGFECNESFKVIKANSNLLVVSKT